MLSCTIAISYFRERAEMSQILSLRIPEQMGERLDLFARRLGNGTTRTKAAVMLLEESLREASFAFIEYRDSPIGRQPCMKGAGLAIWKVVMIARQHEMNAESMAQDYPYPVQNLRSALSFYEAYSEEINQAIEDNDVGFEALKRLLPNLQLFEVAKEITGKASKAWCSPSCSMKTYRWKSLVKSQRNVPKSLQRAFFTGTAELSKRNVMKTFWLPPQKRN